MGGMRAMPPLLLACLLIPAGCSGPTPFAQDGWSIERRFDGRSPALLSTSEINAGTPAASGVIETKPVRTRERGRLRITIDAETSIAAAWTPGAALFDSQLDRALDWLGRLGVDEARGIELRLVLMPPHGARQRKRLHPADQVLVVDLLAPVPAKPRSRSAALEAALATGLHETAHVLRPASALDRHDDEYRASLVAACFRIEGTQRGDLIDFGGRKPAPQRDFTRAHSASAAQAVKRDLAAALGSTSLQGADRPGIDRVLASCTRRLAQAPR